jgi:hypothetical protein
MSRTVDGTPARRWSLLVTLGALLMSAAVVGLVLTPEAQAQAQAGGTQVFSKTVDRVFYNAKGVAIQADPAHPHGYKVAMTVSSTQNLRGDQPLTVSWSGAHPTGGIVANPSYGAQGSEMEYPFILMECRGTKATVTPSTCWTQTSSAERIQRSGAASFPAWRADGAASDAERRLQVGVPPKLPADCAPSATENVHWIPTKAKSGATYYGGCLDDAPEQSEEATTGVPDNTTYGVTGTDGKGSAQFAVWTQEENATLGCSATVACSLVAIPVSGIDCDPYFTQTSDHTGAKLGITPAWYPRYLSKCETPDQWGPGEVSDNLAKFNLATSGQLWWAASNWQNRIVVPLNFAVSGSNCAVVNKTAPVLAYGSVLLTDVTSQWQPTFCTKAGYSPFLHIQATDTQARTLVDSGSIKIGFSSRPPDGGFSSKIAQAPIAVTGFAIAYKIDGADGQPYTSLRLDARLLAKLLSESYAGAGGGDDPGIKGNPTTILADPEFHALNPALPKGLQQVVNSAAAMISLSNDSDMLYALSSYIDADPAARAWLSGTPDPWGMKVNPAYRIDDSSDTASPEPSASATASDPPSPSATADASATASATTSATDAPSGSASDGPTAGPSADPTAGASPSTQPSGGFTLPVSSWPLLDPWSLPDSSDNVCLNDVPFLAQVAHPLTQIAQIEQDIEFGISNSQTRCPEATDINATVAKTEGLQTPGHRFVIGIVPLTALQRYGLAAAALQTSTSVSPGTAFTDASGRSFASPDTSGLTNAVKLLTPDADAGAWTVDYDELSSRTSAYPGLIPVYADVPTTGLSDGDAARVAQLLDFAAGPGQTAGTANGELPPGALPMTAADGLGAEAAYTRCVADQVRAQTGVVPPLTGACPAVPGGGTPSAGASASAGASNGATPVVSGGGAGGVADAPAPAPVDSATAGQVPAGSALTADPIRTVGAYSSIGRFGLPLMLVLGLLLLVAGLVLRWGLDAWALAKVVGPRLRTTRWTTTVGRRRR